MVTDRLSNHEGFVVNAVPKTRQATTRGPLLQKRDKISKSPRDVTSRKAEVKTGAEEHLKAHLMPQVSRPVISPGSSDRPQQTPVRPPVTQRRTRGALGRKVYEMSDRQDRLDAKTKAKRDAKAQKALKTAAKNEAKAKRAQEKAYSGVKRSSSDAAPRPKKRLKPDPRKSSQ